MKSYITSILQEYQINQYNINIVFISDRFMTQLNEHYRKRSGITDVLSFILSAESSPVLEGEVYISREQAGRQAKEFGVPVAEEIVRLATHGILHLAGRTHKTESELKSYQEDTERLMNRYYRKENA